MGFRTLTNTVLALAMSLAEIAAVTCVLLIKVVVRFEPFHWTIEPGRKPVPVSVRVNAAPPSVALEGDMELSCGIAFEKALSG